MVVIPLEGAKISDNSIKIKLLVVGRMSRDDL